MLYKQDSCSKSRCRLSAESLEIARLVEYSVSEVSDSEALCTVPKSVLTPLLPTALAAPRSGSGDPRARRQRRARAADRVQVQLAHGPAPAAQLQ